MTDRPKMKVSCGLITAAVWDNKTQSGDIYHSFTFEKRFKDKQTDKWKSAKSFNTSDLPVLGSLISALIQKEAIKTKSFEENGAAQEEGDVSMADEIRGRSAEEPTEDVPF